jgi:hypothetical protein
MSSFSSVSIPVTMPAPAPASLRVALWWWDPSPWPLPFGWFWTGHRDFDVELLDAGGTVRAWSRGRDGVFERFTYAAQSAAGSLTGRWRVRVHARDVGWLPARVYWTAVASD